MTIHDNNHNKNFANKIKMNRATKHKYRDYPVSESSRECTICCKTIEYILEPMKIDFFHHISY